MDGLDIRDLIDLPRLQRIQDRLAQATGFAMISVDYRGIPVTSPSNFTPFCAATRHKPERRLECFRCDAHGGLQSAIEGKPYFYYCHTGLVDFSVPIMLGSQYLGAWLCGQVKPTDSTVVLQRIGASDESWRADTELMSLYEQIHRVDLGRLYSLADALFEVASYLVQKEYLNTVRSAHQEDQLRALREPEPEAFVPELHLVPDPVTGNSPHPEFSRLEMVDADAIEIPRFRSDEAGDRPTSGSGQPNPSFSFTELAQSVDDRDLVAAISVVEAFLDQVFQRGGKFVGRLRLAEVENNIVLLAQETSSHVGLLLHEQVMRQRSQQHGQRSRYDWQTYLEGLLFTLFDATEEVTAPHPRNITDLLNHIERNVTRTMTLTMAADFMGLSPSHLSRVFKAHTGVCFIDYVTNRRIERAKTMLKRTDIPVLRIANSLNFQPVNYFSRVFKKQTGLTPSEFRRRYTEHQQSA